MAISESLVFVPAVVTVITVILFAVNYSIYRRTKGGSYAFMCWAIASGLYFAGRLIILLGTFITQSSSDLLTVGVGLSYLGSIPGFFVLIGMLFLGVDLKVFKYKKENLRKIQIPFLALASVIFLGITLAGFMGMVTAEFAVVFGSALSALFEIVLWAGAGVMFYPVYRVIRQGTKGWLLVYFGVFTLVISNILEFFIYIGFEFLGRYDMVTSVFYAFFLISGFFLIDRSMKG